MREKLAQEGTVSTSQPQDILLFEYVWYFYTRSKGSNDRLPSSRVSCHTLPASSKRSYDSLKLHSLNRADSQYSLCVIRTKHDTRLTLQPVEIAAHVELAIAVPSVLMSLRIEAIITYRDDFVKARQPVRTRHFFHIGMMLRNGG